MVQLYSNSYCLIYIKSVIEKFISEIFFYFIIGPSPAFNEKATFDFQEHVKEAKIEVYSVIYYL